MVRRKGYPEVGDLVVIRVNNLSPHAAWCSLEEYPHLEGMVHVSEVAGKWVRDIRNFVKEGKMYVARVMRVDKAKNFVSLSLKRVAKTEKKRKMEELRQEQRAEKMLEIAAKQLGKTLDQAYEEVGYLLQENYGNLFQAFEVLVDENGLEELPEEWNKVLLEIVKKSLAEREKKLVAEVKLKTIRPDGIELIKTNLKKFEDKGMVVKYISAPRYRVELTTKDPKAGEKLIHKVFEEISKKFDGEAELKMVS